MGSNSSKGKRYQDTSQYGEIYLITDKTAYLSGEMVTGTIFINMISSYPGKKLFLKFRGKETAHIVRLDDKEEVMDSESKEIISGVTLVHSWDDSIPPGHLSIPFSFLLPRKLPPSFYQQGPRYFAFLEYQLEAFLTPYYDEIPKMKYKQPINIKEKIKFIAEDGSSEVTTVLETCCCLEHGSNLLKVTFENNFFSPGEKAKVSMKLDNSGTSLKNKRIVFSLKQRLELRVKGHKKNLDLLKVGKVYTGVPEGRKQAFGSLNLTLPRFAMEDDFNRAINKMKPDKLTLIKTKENPDVITSTTKSSLITSTFYLEVSCPMDGCCATLPLAKCMIRLLSPDVLLPPVNAPDNWQPLTLDNVTLAFTFGQNQPLPKSEQSNKMIEAGAEIGKKVVKSAAQSIVGALIGR